MIRNKLIVLAFFWLISADSVARAGDLQVTSSRIEGNAFQDLRGVAFINEAAGDSNLQFNAAAIALNEFGVALATITAVQRVEGNRHEGRIAATVRIEDSAFANADGLILVNQVAGFNNIQANLVTIAVGIEGVIVAEADLSQSRSDANSPIDPEANRLRRASVADKAFEGAAGVVQVSQAAGSGNTLFNRFALSMSAGTSR